MKNIKLTEEHKVKLLEMCKKLFPEYVEITIGEQYSQADTSFCEEDLDKPCNHGFGFDAANCGEVIFFCIKKENGSKYGKKIHWFEFCMTHLARVLMCKNTKHMQQLFMGLKHPVDYLYDNFVSNEKN